MSAWIRALARVAELRDALTELRNIGDDNAALDVRRILVAETLDLGSHRLDAWLTGIVERRRALLRASKPKGVIVGAYGWVENLQRSGAQGPNRDAGSFTAQSRACEHGGAAPARISRTIPTPAATTHSPSISRARVRVALDLIEGLRQGQTLAALLGYRIERSLHEQKLDRLVLSLRALAPLVDGQLDARRRRSAAGGSGRCIERRRRSQAHRAVHRESGTRCTRPSRTRRRTIHSSSRPIGRASPTIESSHCVDSERDRRNDAHADLVLAEAVLQSRKATPVEPRRPSSTPKRWSRADRADGHSDAESRYPVHAPDYAHRVCRRWQRRGWNAERPRAKAEPRLEAWAASRLGSAANVIVFAAADGTLASLDAAGVAALDVIYESANLVRLEQAIKAAMPAIPADAPLTSARDAAWPADAKSFLEIAELAASIRELLVRARIAGPGDFTRSSDASERTVSDDELNAIEARATDARVGLAAALVRNARPLLPAPGVVAPPPDDATLSAALEGVAAYGVATPRSGGEMYLAMAQMASAEAHRRLDATDKLLAGTFDAQAAAAVSQALFGDGFWMIPALTPPANPDLFSRSLAGGGAVAPARGAIRRFIRDVASVRDAVERLSESLLFGDALGVRANLRVAQLATPGTPGVNRWVGRDARSRAANAGQAGHEHRSGSTG